MEKSGKLLMTQEDFDFFYQEGIVSESLRSKGVTSYSQLKEIIDSGEYETI
jgi:hypothetical protein